jgi:hypothetical protein
MKTTELMHRFQAFNRTFDSDLYFPELAGCAKTGAPADVQIAYGKIAADGINAPLKSGPFFQMNQRNFWMNIPKVARFLVADGERILIDPDSHVNEERLRVFILESCFKALLSQQNILVLEGSAIQIGPDAVLFLAPSGFGKSTLASMFLKRGYRVLTDEICAINQTLHLLPSYPAINLWANIAKQVGIDSTSLKPINPTVEKYRLELNKNGDSKPLPIKLIYMLDYHKKNELLLTEIAAESWINRVANCVFAQTDKDSLYALAQSVQRVTLTLPRWDFGMNQLGFLLAPLLDTIERDALQRTN